MKIFIVFQYNTAGSIASIVAVCDSHEKARKYEQKYSSIRIVDVEVE